MSDDNHKAGEAVNNGSGYFTGRPSSRHSSSSPTPAPDSSSKPFIRRLYDRTIMGRGLMWAYKGTRRFLIKREED